jgi:hypothetical protein
MSRVFRGAEGLCATITQDAAEGRRHGHVSLMPHLADFRPASYQATLFTPAAAVASAAFLTRFLPRWAHRFDGDPVTIPLPEGVPVEIPKIILQSRSQEWRCEVASARMNVVWRSAAPSDSAPGLREFYETVVPMLEEYREFIGSPITRVAAVTIRFAPHAHPASYLAHHFCQDRWLVAPFNRPENFELHAHKEFRLTGDLVVNSWVRNKTGTVNGGGPIVVIEQDLNTPAEGAQYVFDGARLREFFDAAIGEFDRILELYYPADIE